MAAQQLIEREAEWAALAARWAAIDAPAAPGAVVLVRAEAGGGKTALLRAFAAAQGLEVGNTHADGAAGVPSAHEAWWCSVEQRLAPEPLAALRDIQAHVPRGLAAAGTARGSEWLAGWLKLLRSRPRPLLWVLDDVQWADSATLELLRYLARRVAGLRLMLVLLVRKQAVPPGHPLLALLGALPTGQTLRLEPAALSLAAVQQLAARTAWPVDAIALHHTSGGNPFLVAEALAAPRPCDRPPGGLPAAVREQLRARIAALDSRVEGSTALDSLAEPAHWDGPAGRAFDLIAAAGGTLAAPLLAALQDDSATAIERLTQATLVQQLGEQLVLRHDLLHQARAAEWSAAHARSLHERLYLALHAAGAGAARCVWHAHQARLGSVVLELAPAVCRHALAAGSLREAADAIDLVLPWIDTVPTSERAALWVLHAQAQAQAQRPAAALRSREQAFDLHAAAGQWAAAGTDKLESARAHWLLGDLARGLRLGTEAAGLLDTHGSAHQRAAAQATLAQLHMFDAQAARALHWGRLALAQFEAGGDVSSTVDVLNTVGFAQAVCSAADADWAPIRRCRELALAHGLHAQAARACVNLCSLALVQRRLGELAEAVDAGVKLARQHDLDLHLSMLLLRRAWGQAHAGQWACALAQALALFELPGLRAIEAQQARCLVNLLHLRQGGAARTEAAAWWQDMLRAGQLRRAALGALASPAASSADGEPRDPQESRRSSDAVDPWYAPRAPLLAEAAWLMGQREVALEVARAAWPAALARGEPWRTGALAVWQWRCAGAVDLPTAVPLPAEYALELQGRHAEAAVAWSARGCAYEAALVQHAANPAAARVALERIGAAGTWRALERERRLAGDAGDAGDAGAAVRAGAAPARRGAGRATRADPLGLTARERTVLDALVHGLPNRAIAARLARSERTVEHHVAALLAKLHVQNRADAVALATQAGATAADRTDAVRT